MPNSVLRKYTPPTCTLEISAKESPLSRWMGQSVLKHLRFKLSFDDPRVSEDQWATVRGDRSQLETLCEVVTTYVQQFLNQSTSLLTEGHSGSTLLRTSEEPPSTLSVLDPPSTSNAIPPNPKGISIQPRGILSHELSLGSLATEEAGASIRLSAVQLADLATALDEYAADVTALPNLSRPSWVQNPPQWTTIAATFLVTLGLTTSALRLFDRPNPTTADAPTTSQGASSADQRLALQPLPSSPSPLPTAPPPLSAIPNPPPLTAGAPETTSDDPANSANDTPKVSVPPTNPPKIKITEPPEGSVLVNPIPTQESPANLSPDPIPPSSAITQPSRAAANPEASASASRAETAPSKDSTAFDTIPQVAEVRQYFQGRWKPSPGLTEDLQYRLVLNPDGSLNQNLPLNDAAGVFLDRPEVGMPLYNTPFVSPLKNGRTAIIRVVLGQDGSVQTFNESE
ncbi:MAG: DUF4335 domain-containing protein [Leptolyngbyaceae cyanobacterium CSU_1_3]|nr:DUF4335 domain-containing protein [Leptolyngbyaceae cyanobacterium CSU_1_3]